MKKERKTKRKDKRNKSNIDAVWLIYTWTKEKPVIDGDDHFYLSMRNSVNTLFTNSFSTHVYRGKSPERKWKQEGSKIIALSVLL